MRSHSGTIIILLFLIFLLPCCKKAQSPKEVLYVQFNNDLSTLIFRNEQFLGFVRTMKNKAELQAEFLKLRMQYKKVEAFTEYFFPTTVRLVNGAPLDEVEDEENAVFEPGGLQVIEELIYTTDSLERDELVRHVR
ncbi:cytochrome C peroxidase, partial [Dyadobacter flavalbus]